ncbi:uncharacterized protein HMPREF1541_09616 [Cyphellophora europaea CBS 101466]|uniref:Uncharacterized protein n=1 Tax=Cyphellophora europaea (strain CBS 101466) TaxID=1220924 RepID=W2SCM2_CYPE1|nr:uncharacterized protein HMPREF1541_09616 [Cyphellophora europaea CBS 101466]ETN45783.1 hypothetical protein HMPREF1541_09616 [Cyphellophora europaea CBS 101466]
MRSKSKNNVDTSLGDARYDPSTKSRGANEELAAPTYSQEPNPSYPSFRDDLVKPTTKTLRKALNKSVTPSDSVSQVPKRPNKSLEIERRRTPWAKPSNSPLLQDYPPNGLRQQASRPYGLASTPLRRRQHYPSPAGPRAVHLDAISCAHRWLKDVETDITPPLPRQYRPGLDPRRKLYSGSVQAEASLTDRKFDNLAHEALRLQYQAKAERPKRRQERATEAQDSARGQSKGQDRGNYPVNACLIPTSNQYSGTQAGPKTVKELRAHVTRLQADNQLLKEDIEGLCNEVATLRRKLRGRDATQERTAALLQQYKTKASQVSKLWEEMAIMHI